MSYILKCKNYGLLTNTEVENEDGRVLVTNGLNIEDLVELWRWYYNIPFWKSIKIVVNKDLYLSMKQRPLSSSQSVEELFYTKNVFVEAI